MDKRFSPGLIQLYIGNGKGKTTAALGQGLRAAGRGYRVKMIQFLKGTETGELSALQKHAPEFMVYRFQTSGKPFWELDEQERETLKMETGLSLSCAKKILAGNECAMLILDEVLGALKHGMLTTDQVLELMDLRSPGVELILTGREAPEEILERADLVTEMKMIRHPFQAGVPAREGIEK